MTARLKVVTTLYLGSFAETSSLSSSSSIWDWGEGSTLSSLSTSSSFSSISSIILDWGELNPTLPSTTTASASSSSSVDWFWGKLKPTPTSATTTVSSSSAVVDVEILFELLYQALERTRDRLKRSKRREAESPSLLEEEDLAFFEDDETEQPSRSFGGDGLPFQ